MKTKQHDKVLSKVEKATHENRNMLTAEPNKKQKFKNKQRTLIFAARGITASHRFLMKDLKVLMPHSKSESKFDGDKHDYQHINEVCELKKCMNCLFFESRSHGKELFMYASKSPIGPTCKFLVTNSTFMQPYIQCLTNITVSTMDELKLTGNCLKYSRPLLHFDSNFDTEPINWLTI